MSCRRKDHRNLVGCKIGAVGIRGCSRECCPYKDEDKIYNERISYGEHASWQGFDKDSSFLDPSSPRHRPCRHHYRPKYVCVPCRRTFKLHFHPELEYYFREFDNTYFCRPRATFSEQCAFFGLNGRTLHRFEEIEHRRGTVISNSTRYSDEELKDLKKIDPWRWTPLADLRCPGCGEQGRLVGSTFEAPRLQDSKGWTMVAQKLDEGERFLFCPSLAQHDDLMAEGRRLMEKSTRAVEWEAEKSRRIAALKSEPAPFDKEGLEATAGWHTFSDSQASTCTEVGSIPSEQYLQCAVVIVRPP